MSISYLDLPVFSLIVSPQSGRKGRVRKEREQLTLIDEEANIASKAQEGQWRRR